LQGLLAEQDREFNAENLRAEAAEQRIAELGGLVAKKFDADLMELSEEEFAEFVGSMREAREIFTARAVRGDR
jgi:hypothetical protein